MEAKKFALVAGSIIGVTGLMGMFKAMRAVTFEKRDELRFDAGYGKIAGAIPTNNLFNWVRLGIGAAGIVAARDESTAKIYNRALAVSYAGMAVAGVVPKLDTLFGVMPIFGGNVVLHAGTAAAELLTEDELIAKAKDLVPSATKDPRIASRRSGAKRGTSRSARV